MSKQSTSEPEQSGDGVSRRHSSSQPAVSSRLEAWSRVLTGAIATSAGAFGIIQLARGQLEALAKIPATTSVVYIATLAACLLGPWTVIKGIAQVLANSKWGRGKE